MLKQCLLRWGLVLSSLMLSQSLYADGHSHEGQDESLQERLDALEEELLDLRFQVNSGGESLTYTQGGINTSIGGYFLGIARSAYRPSVEADRPLVRDRDEIETDAFFYFRLKTELNDQWTFNFGELIGKAETFSSFNRTVDLYSEYSYADNHYLSYGVQKTPIGAVTRAVYPTSFNGDFPNFLGRSFGGPANGLFHPVVMTGFKARGQFLPTPSQVLSYGVMHGSYDAFDPIAVDGSNTEDPVRKNTAARLAWGLSNKTFDLGINYFKGSRQLFEVPGVPATIGGQRYESFGADLRLSFKALEVTAEYYETDEGRSINGRELESNELIYVAALYHLNSSWALFYTYEKLDTPSVDGEVTEDFMIPMLGTIPAGGVLPGSGLFSQGILQGQGDQTDTYGIRYDGWERVQPELSLSIIDEVDQRARDTHVVIFSVRASF